MGLKEQIEGDIKQAMLQKDKETLTALRGIKSMILLAETEKGAVGSIDEDTELKLLSKAAKQRRESADIYREKGRDDLAENELVELRVIEQYLPKQMTEEEVVAEIKATVSEVGASGPSDMGKVMGVISKKLAGKADNKIIASKVKEVLSGL